MKLATHELGDPARPDPELPLENWVANARARRWTWPSRDAFLADVREGAPRMTPELEAAVLAGMTEEPDGSLRADDAGPEIAVPIADWLDAR